MTTYVALLRAVNVGSTNRIRMADLRAAFVDAGYADVVTHIQTGNVIFTSRAKAASVKSSVESLVHERFGLTTPAIIRTAGELAAVAASNPFVDGSTDVANLAVVFLDAKPSAVALAAFLASSIGDDGVRVEGSEVYIRYARSAAETKLSPAVWKRLGVAGTARNWNVTTTLARLAAVHGAAPAQSGNRTRRADRPPG